MSEGLLARDVEVQPVGCIEYVMSGGVKPRPYAKYRWFFNA